MTVCNFAADVWNDIVGIEVTTTGSVFKLLLSLLLGSLVGFERKRKGQTAGVRTFALISMGAALAMILSIYVPQEYLGLKNGDPGRIAAQVVTGIGFLGAGAIIQMKGSVRGLTTAAGIWMVAAIGMAVGVGMYATATIATLLILFVLLWLERFERTVNRGCSVRTLRLKLDCIVADIEPYRTNLAVHNVVLTKYYIDFDYSKNETGLNLIVLVPDGTDDIALLAGLRHVYPTLSLTLANEISI